MKSIYIRTVPIVLVATLSTASAGVVPSFQSLGDLPGGVYFSSGFALSADGSVAVGVSSSTASDPGHTEAFRWSAADGIVGLGMLPGQPYSTAHETSANGAVVVGNSGPTAFRWTAGTGLVSLGDLPGGVTSSFAYGVNGSGDVVVGRSSSSSSTSANTEAFRWTQATGMVGLGDLPGGVFNSRAHSITSDGAVIVGRGTSANGSEAFRWTSGGGMVGLGFLPNGGDESSATDVSADGSVVVGSGSTNTNSETAFRWTAADGMISLGVLDSGFPVSFSEALATSADGSVIVGSSFGSGGFEGFLWTQDDGMRAMMDILTDDYGIDLTGWEINTVSDISADGMTIVGTGRNPAGNTVGWIATIPEPTTGALALLAGAIFTRRRRDR